MVVIDDSLGFPSLVRTWLHQDGRFEVVGMAPGAVRGRELVAELGPDVVLLDLVLPDAPDPVAVIAKLREAHPAAAIVLVSSLPPEHLLHAAKVTGADAICHKGSAPEELVGAVYAAASAAGSETQNRLP